MPDFLMSFVILFCHFVTNGMGDWSGFMDINPEVVPMDQGVVIPQKLFEGNLTLRMMYEQFKEILERDSIGQVL